ncbi:diadenylate cyclase CdaA [Eshraghiella crossota]|jgi:diadenylate cyclase|uniref:Diadenylate cyclase n=1 Tax=Eshraghiella crossota DSM 2876 TaxID=511680 RepID=D4S1T4_9FIRM|nr:diadenylate cyclase CdaA [Butyrivibrio crossotus]EFF67832.1 TIGR00159 family protein [Butyrivibrio crossotus DSM 2876]UWO51429.1 diadenylate cyclase CdaA [Butyrivibrio crossotus]
MSAISNFIEEYISNIYIPRTLRVSNIFEIIILAIILYEFMAWVKTTRAFALLKGIIVILVFLIIAYIFDFTTILWIAGKVINIAIIAVVVIFQPELRKALEQLGQKKYFKSLLPFTEKKDKGERFSDKTVNELVRACFELAKNKTGALIVIEQDILLTDYEKTGIPVDGIVTSQLLINIFEHNTPLHDGAVIVRGDRIVSATCYLPLSDNMQISKELGTRHRAAVGISEVTDTMTLVVSEETGNVSIAIAGELIRAVDQDYLKKKLTFIQKKSIDVKRYKLWKKGASDNEKR